jgi:hypothetical protein
MDQRIESFLADVLALAGEEPDVVRHEVRVALTDCKEILRAQEEKKRISLGSLSRPRLLCRLPQRAEEMHRVSDHVMPLRSCSCAFARQPLGCKAAWSRPAASTVRSATSTSLASARFPHHPRLQTASR